jgi:voltage-dependent anion channel protein 2
MYLQQLNVWLHRIEKGDVLKASYSHTMNPMTKTTIAAEIGHIFSRNENTMMVGGLYEFDMSTIVKARLNNFGKIGALVPYEWRPKSTITFTGEVDTKALENSAKIGLALAMTS